MPSVRDLKDQYQLSVSTIQSGYEYLMIHGLVESIPKSGYYVSQQTNKQTNKNVEEPKSERIPVIRDAIFKDHLGLTTSARTRNTCSEFNVAAPGDLFVPQKLVLRTMQQVIREQVCLGTILQMALLS